MSSESKDFSAASHFGEQVKLRRELRNESLQDVANAIGTTKGHLWQLETGGIKNPRLKAAIALAGHFGCSVEDLACVEPLTQEATGVPRDVLTQIRELNPKELGFLRSILRGIPQLRTRSN